jgi:protein TonB
MVFIFNPSSLPQKQKIKVEIKEVIKPKEIPPEKPFVLQTAARPNPAEPKQREPRKIFGINKNTLTDTTNAAGVAIKAGNTIAKEIDQEALRPEDEQALPIPTEEYLISKMPNLKSEVRIPYPPEARKNNIEGLVVLEILIDETGKVRAASLIEGPGYGLNEAALNAIYSFAFSPAMVEQKPVAVKIRYGYRFILN